MSAESNPVPAGRFARVDRRGIAIVTATETEGVKGFRETMDVFKRAWIAGYAKALANCGPQTSDPERAEKWRGWYAEDAEKQYGVEFPS